MIRKDFAKAFLFWLFFGGIGAHRVYISEKVTVLLWYWAANICTLGILGIVDVFLLKGMIDKQWKEDQMKAKVEAL
jgi:TM2 domain-containing membrane protein YozV